METKNNSTPFMATHPGEVLLAELAERGMTQKAFAEQIGMRSSHLNELIRGKRPITKAIADKFDTALGIDSIFWLNLQTQYDYDTKVIKASKPDSITLEVSIDDISLASEIKRAISLLKGVSRVAVL